MTWFQLIPRGHHGYPQPVDSFAAATYENRCPHCGIHGKQVKPFRIRVNIGADHSSFLQLNWLFEVFLVHPDVIADCDSAGIQGMSAGDVLNHKTGTPVSQRVQLQVLTTIQGALVDLLPRVTCRKNNEEGFSSLRALELGAPYCGRVKHHPPTRLGLARSAVENAPDIFLVGDWFGSGASAWRATVVSARFADLLRARKWRGVQLKPVAIDEPSIRDGP